MPVALNNTRPLVLLLFIFPASIQKRIAKIVENYNKGKDLDKFLYQKKKEGGVYNKLIIKRIRMGVIL